MSVVLGDKIARLVFDIKVNLANDTFVLAGFG